MPEKNDVAAQHPEIAQQLGKPLHAWRKETGALTLLLILITYPSPTQFFQNVMERTISDDASADERLHQYQQTPTHDATSSYDNPTNASIAAYWILPPDPNGTIH